MRNKQQNIILRLKEKGAYSHTTYGIKIIETHVSWIFLTGKYAYKVKKAVKFGNILDFSTLRLRKKYCQNEVLVNRFLCDHIYQEVVKIVRRDGHMKFRRLPDSGTPIEYAVKMLELPQRFRMDNLLRANKINDITVQTLARILCKFHNTAVTNSKIQLFGKHVYMKMKIEENFKTLSKFIKLDNIYRRKLVSFIKNNKKLFRQRINEEKIRDIHGDLYLKNIFLMNKKFYFYDRIEFNDSLRYADVAEDVGHLAMDLDYHGREDLREQFVATYVRRCKDSSLMNLIYFIMSYKASVRAKVSLFRASQCTDDKSREHYKNEAHAHFQLARKYIELL